MVADAFDHRLRAGIAHREALARDAAEVGLAVDRAVEHDVAGDDVLGRLAAELGRGLHRDAAAGESLAAVVVGVADEIEPHAAREERAEALPGRAGEAHVDGVVGQAVVAVALGDLACDSMVPTVRLMLRIGVSMVTFSRALERRLRQLDQAVVERLLQAVVLRLAVVARHLGRHLRHVEDAREVEALRLPVLDALAHVEQVGAADQLVDASARRGFAISSRASSATKKK